MVPLEAATCSDAQPQWRAPCDEATFPMRRRRHGEPVDSTHFFKLIRVSSYLNRGARISRGHPSSRQALLEVLLFIELFGNVRERHKVLLHVLSQNIVVEHICNVSIGTSSFPPFYVFRLLEQT